MVYDKVEAHYEKERGSEAARLPSLSRYTKIKAWQRMDDGRAECRGEEGKLGALVLNDT